MVLEKTIALREKKEQESVEGTEEKSEDQEFTLSEDQIHELSLELNSIIKKEIEAYHDEFKIDLLYINA